MSFVLFGFLFCFVLFCCFVGLISQRESLHIPLCKDRYLQTDPIISNDVIVDSYIPPYLRFVHSD